MKVYKNFALPKMIWILMVNEILPTALRKITGKVENLIKNWWHLPRSTSRDALRLVLGLPSLSDLAEQGQLIKHHIAQSSKDPKVKGVWVSRNRRLHKPTQKLRKVFGPDLPSLRSEAKKTLSVIQRQDLQKTVEQLSVQGSWSKLGFGEEVERKWKGVLWSLPSTVTQFASKAALDVLPTRANLLRWRMACDGSCPRCGVKETLQHVLNHCEHLLLSGAYKWRHDCILQEMFRMLSSKKTTQTQILVDLPGHEYMLPFTPDSAWRPDLVLYDEGVDITFVELTVPFEENVYGAHKRKTEKYQKLLENAKNAGFVPALHCVEMGSRGLPGPSWTALAKKFPFGKTLTQKCSALAIRASFYIWAQRFGSWSSPPVLTTNAANDETPKGFPPRHKSNLPPTHPKSPRRELQPGSGPVGGGGVSLRTRDTERSFRTLTIKAKQIYNGGAQPSWRELVREALQALPQRPQSTQGHPAGNNEATSGGDPAEPRRGPPATATDRENRYQEENACGKHAADVPRGFGGRQTSGDRHPRHESTATHGAREKEETEERARGNTNPPKPPPQGGGKKTTNF